MGSEGTQARTVFRLKSLGLALACVAVLFGTGQVVDGDHLPGWEESLFRFFNDLPAFLYPVLWPFMQLGNLLAVPVALIAALLFRRWLVAVGIAAIGAGKLYLGQVVKDLFVRHRPAVILDEVHARDDTGLGQAFVSGHVVVVVALATLVHPYVSRRWRVVMWSLVVIVGLGRIYVGAHLPLDVVGGAALGATMGLVLHALFGPPSEPREEE